MDTTKQTGAESVTWNFSLLYTGIDDPAIERDIADWCERAKVFNSTYKAALATKLGPALEELETLKSIIEQISLYLLLKSSQDTSDSTVSTVKADAETRLSQADGEHMAFFVVELCALSDEDVAQQATANATVQRLLPFIERTREQRLHILSEAVEGALARRSPFGSHAWGEFSDEFMSALTAQFRGEEKNLTELLHVANESSNGDERAEALKTLDTMLSGHYARFAAHALWVTVGSKSVNQRDRKFAHPMSDRNLDNRVSDEVVDALHKGVRKTAVPLARRYYRLKAAHLGQKTLRWSDRNAPMPFADDSFLPWSEAVKLVLESRERFSPIVAARTREMIEAGWIDANPGKHKRGGAFNATSRLRDGRTVTHTLMSYLGSPRDLMTLSHELGHGEHGLFAGDAQGPLQMDPPMGFAEIFSTFGETMTFNLRKERLIAAGDSKALLAAIMDKLDDMMNTVVRQMAFSEFERQLHGWNPDTNVWEPPRKRSEQELSDLWLDTTHQFYGESGDVFTYDDMSQTWACVPHFHSPFYVYVYALDELLTQALDARQAQLGAAFEPAYIAAMRAGNTKPLAALMQPLGLDVRRPAFWAETCETGIGGLLTEAEELSKTMGVSV